MSALKCGLLLPFKNCGDKVQTFHNEELLIKKKL